MSKKVDGSSDLHSSHFREENSKSWGKTALKVAGLSVLFLTFAGVAGIAGFGIYHFSLYSIGFYSSVALAGADLILFTGSIVVLCCLSRGRNKAVRIAAKLSKPDYDSDIEVSKSNEKSNSKKSNPSDSEPEVPKKSKKHRKSSRSSEHQKKDKEVPALSGSQTNELFMPGFDFVRPKSPEASSSSAVKSEDEIIDIEEVARQEEERGTSTLDRLKIPDAVEDLLAKRAGNPPSDLGNRKAHAKKVVKKMQRRSELKSKETDDLKAKEEPKKPEELKLPDEKGVEKVKKHRKKGTVELDFGGTTEIDGISKNGEEAAVSLEDQLEKTPVAPSNPSEKGNRRKYRRDLEDLKKNGVGHIDRQQNKFVYNQDQLYTEPVKDKPKKEVHFDSGDSSNWGGTTELRETEDAKEHEHNDLYDKIFNSEQQPIEEIEEKEITSEAKSEEEPQQTQPQRMDSSRELAVLPALDIPCVYAEEAPRLEAEWEKIDQMKAEAIKAKKDAKRKIEAKKKLLVSFQDFKEKALPKLELAFPEVNLSDEEGKSTFPPIRILEEYPVKKKVPEALLKETVKAEVPKPQKEVEVQEAKSFWKSYVTPGLDLIKNVIQAPIKLVGNLLNDVFQLEGGPIQKRTYYHLLAPLIDVLFDFLESKPNLKDATMEEKLAALRNILETQETPLSFLERGTRSNDVVELHLYAALQPLLQLQESDVNTFTARQNFFAHIEKIYQSKDYKIFLECATSGSYTEAKVKFPLVALAQELGFAIFTIVHLHKLAEECVRDVIKEGKGNRDPFGDYDSSKNNINEVLEADFAAIAHAPRTLRGTKAFEIYNKLAGHLNVFFHPLETNNFASQIFKSVFKDKNGNTKFVECLRFGTPTTEGWENPEIVSQMYLFLDHCAAIGKKVISFQHQNPKEKGIGKGNEKPRLNKMFELGSKEEYKNTFFVFGLPMDGEFFNQTGKFADQDNIEVFKGEFLVNMLSDDAGFHLPQDQMDALKIDYASGIKATLNKVHQHFFKGKKELTQEERKIFQILAYIYLEEYFVLSLNGDYYHSQCKDAMDRAMVVLALTNYLHLLRSGTDTDSQAIQDFRVLVHFAALMIKGTPMHHGRSQLLLSVLDHLSKLSKEEKVAIQKDPVHEAYVFQKAEIAKENNQSFEKRPSEAKDIGEFTKLLKIGSNYKYQLFFPNFVEEVITETKETDLLKQYDKDVGREILLVKSEKIEIPEFKAKLLETYPELNQKSTEGFAKGTLIDAIVTIEAQNIDPNEFSRALGKVLKAANLESAQQGIFELRNHLLGKAFKQKLLALLNNDAAKAERILKISNQASLPNVTGCIFKRYDFYDKDDKTNLLFKAKQRNTNHGRCNSCINLIVNKNKLYVECYQIFEILNMQTGDVLGYIKTKTLIDVATENATIEWLAPTTNNPKNFFPVIKESDDQERVEVEDDELKLSFLMVKDPEIKDGKKEE